MDSNLKSFDDNVNSHFKHKNQKIKDFKEYLVKSDLLLAYIKFLLSLRQMKDKPKDPLQIFHEFFSTYKHKQSWEHYEKLQKDLEDLIQENHQCRLQIDQLHQDIANRKTEIEEEEIRKREEEEQLKNAKDKKKK